jgi:hypothetical protein
VTDLYGLRVLALEPDKRRVRLRVFELYDEGGDFDCALPDEDASFFLRVLWDVADIRSGGGGPLGELVSVDEILDEEWVDNHTWRFIAGFERLADYNVPFTDDERARQPEIEFWGLWFTNEEWLVQSDFDVSVTDTRWLAHLSLGQQWTTASYATTAVRPQDLPHVPTPQPAVGTVTAVQRSNTADTGDDPDAEHIPFDYAAMRALAEASEAPTGAELDAIRGAHRQWLDSGGGYADLATAWSRERWRVLNASGYSLAVYEGPQGTMGTQASLRSRVLFALELREIDLPWADLTAVVAEDADLSGANVVGSTMTDSHLSRIDLSGAQLALPVRGPPCSRRARLGSHCSTRNYTGTDAETVCLRDPASRGKVPSRLAHSKLHIR